MAKRNQHVVHHKGGWAVRGAASQRATSVHPTQQAAIDAARGIARAQGTELFIHGRDGRIRARDSYGNDPYPPQGVAGGSENETEVEQGVERFL